VNQAAFEMVRRSTSEQVEKLPEIVSEVTKPSKYDISAVMAEMGRRGGQIGGKRRLKTMTKAERSKVAKKAAKARWKKYTAKNNT
jgi:ferritin-like metal-binding protein YciE